MNPNDFNEMADLKEHADDLIETATQLNEAIAALQAKRLGATAQPFIDAVMAIDESMNKRRVMLLLAGIRLAKDAEGTSPVWKPRLGRIYTNLT